MPIKSPEMVEKYLNSRVLMVNKEADYKKFLSTLEDNVKIHVFTVAQVTRLNVLEKIKDYIDDHTQGKTTFTDCKNRIDNMMKIEDPTHIIRASKIRFIIQQEYIKATAVGQYYDAMQPQKRKDFPFFKFVSILDRFTRQSHSQYNGLILAKDHPFWDTHFPPLDFNCRCMVDNAYFGPDEKDKNQSKLQELAAKNVGIRESESGFAFNPRDLFENQDITSLRPVSQKKVMERVKTFMKQSKGGRCTFVCTKPDPSRQVHNVINVQKEKIAFQESEVIVQKMFKDVDYDMSKLTDYKYQTEKLNMKDIPSHLVKALPERVNCGKLDNVIAEKAGTISKPVNFTLHNSDDFGMRHEWKHHKEFFENSEYGLNLINRTLGCKGARITKTYTRTRRGVETNILIQNTQENCVCVLREFDDRFEIISVHELNNVYYPDMQAGIFQIAK